MFVYLYAKRVVRSALFVASAMIASQPHCSKADYRTGLHVLPEY